jgi:hypothetical protein
LRAAGEHILEEANRTVPLREGVLQATGSVDSDESQAVISYDGPYARRQHEEMTYRHAPGRRAKWLQLTVQERASAVVGYLERALRGAIR